MKFPYKKEIDSLDQTKLVARDFSEKLKLGDIVVLNGNLGSGKTTFVQMICSNWGIKDTSSPTFSIVNEYSGYVDVYHFDFYRLKKIEELYDIGFEEYINESNAITFIEWGNLIPEILPKVYYNLNITSNQFDKRFITIEKYL